MHAIKLITFAGEDKPGLSASLLEVLAEHDAAILDIGQAVIHKTLSLGILVGVQEEAAWPAIAKELLYRAYELGLKVKFGDVETGYYNQWVNAEGKPRYIITLLGARHSAGAIAQVADICFRHGLNIDVITRLSGRIPLERATTPSLACIELSVRGRPKDPDALRAELMAIGRDPEIDIAFQVDDVYRRNRRLVAFDMDSTLIQTEVINELADRAGVGEKVAEITESAMRGELDFNESLSQRLALLEGLPESVLEEVANSLPITEGAERLIAMLKRLGYKVALISGGFTYFARCLQEKLGIDYICANELEVIDGKLTGKVIGPVVDAERKATVLQEFAERDDIRLEQVIAVGDGANDLPMLAAAGLGIAFRAKPLVAQSADHSLSTVGLDGILYLIGVRDRETLREFEGR